jgi:O-antigen/teichoic acid export membrane protein
MTKSQLQTLISGRILARNTIYSLIGQGAPLLVAVFAIPQLIKGLGTDRFGILTLAWMVLSYFSLFDLGLGRALTQLVAEKLGKESGEEEIPALVGTASFLMLILGLVGTLVFVILSPAIVYNVLKIPTELRSETVVAFYLLSASVPLITSTAGTVGILSALQRFDLINAVRIPLGLLMFLGPVLVLPFSQSLVPVIAVLLAIRFLAWGIYIWLCLHAMPSLQHQIQFNKALLVPLLKFGGWMTVTNIVGPLMIYMDRFLIGGLISVTAVAYYTTPYEVVTKLWLIPGSLVSVLFPAFSTSFVQEPLRAKQMFNRGVKYIFLILFPITLIIVTFANEGLTLWIGKDFAQNSTLVLQWLAVGILINSLSQVPFALIQGVGRPDITAKFHFIELPFYLLILWKFTTDFGIVGAAYAWVLRVSLDTVLLFYMASRFIPNNKSLMQFMGFAVGVTLLILGLASLKLELYMKGIYCVLILFTFMVTTWVLILETDERTMIKNKLKAG